MLAIKGSPDGPPTVGDLAERLAIRHNSAVGLINRLVSAGYVTRRDDPSDKRRASLALTKAGEAILTKLSAAHRAELRASRRCSSRWWRSCKSDGMGKRWVAGCCAP